MMTWYQKALGLLAVTLIMSYLAGSWLASRNK